jgi:hypothetical protein
MVDDRNRSRSRSRDRNEGQGLAPYIGSMTADQIANLPMFANAGGVSGVVER